MSFKHTRLDRFILFINYVLLALAVFIVVVPLLYVAVASFMEPTALLNKGFSLSLSDYSIEGYKLILSNDAMLRGFLNALFYSAAFAILTVALSVFAGFPLSVEGFVGSKFFMTVLIITMFFGGGLIPTFLVVKQLGMLDTVWAVILPGAVSVWNVILARTFFKGVPKELSEAAKVDGASEARIFFDIIIPLSKPIMFVLALYAFVGQWNSFFDAMIYLENQKLYPLQLVLRSILIQNQISPEMIADRAQAAELKRLSEIIKYASIVISSLPLLVMYPFFQKYFEKGVLVGSLK
ncbi:putative aldouronate transport system permease protein [Paenibacillus phyllosphaerae]|uniref:Putative aldouronate transport system permease protein n=1 Tax=Paenibacillus phyllosphaerae TaxID=274593 RepID=A0A7W5B3X7_9BACL|nr:carbohydrate ABC transporter permease [Paenibacillus phyllosphaerae]MBB3113959.1 putative aldouronate transport system permease protein [Paenibacillus phyllosphaerae]